MNATATQHEPTMCYKSARKGWEVYFITADKRRFDGTVRSVDFSTGKRTSVNVDVMDNGESRLVSVKNGSFDSSTFRSK